MSERIVSCDNCPLASQLADANVQIAHTQETLETLRELMARAKTDYDEKALLASAFASPSELAEGDQVGAAINASSNESQLVISQLLEQLEDIAVGANAITCEAEPKRCQRGIKVATDFILAQQTIRDYIQQQGGL